MGRRRLHYRVLLGRCKQDSGHVMRIVEVDRE